MQVMEHAFDDLDAPIGRVCAGNVPVPYAATLEPVVIPDKDRIVAAVRQVLEGAELPMFQPAADRR